MKFTLDEIFEEDMTNEQKNAQSIQLEMLEYLKGASADIAIAAVMGVLYNIIKGTEMDKETQLRLIDAFIDLMNAVTDYISYEHDGDPWAEDARAMGEMELDDLERSGKLEEYKQLLQKITEPFKDEKTNN